MTKNKNKLIFLLTGLIFLGFLVLSILGYKDYSSIIQQEMIVTSELVSNSILLEMENVLVKPIFVSKMLANTYLLENYDSNQVKPRNITDYLSSIQQEYDYNVTYFVSNKTKTYYQSDGTIKKLNPQLPEDRWVEDFIQKDNEYEFHMNRRPNIAEDIMLYVNYAIKDGETTIGVVGVGIELKELQKILLSYSVVLDGIAYLTNADGTVQIHAGPHPAVPANRFSENQPLIESEKLDSEISFFNEESLLDKEREVSLVWSDEINDYIYITSYYIEDIDLYLIVETNYEFLDYLLLYQKIKVITIFVIAFLLVVILVVRVATKYHKKNEKYAKTDYLTNISNRSAFDEYLSTALVSNRVTDSNVTLAIIDVDNFKIINDVHGHIIGDKILINTANHFKSFIREKDIVARWGGDEFAIIFHCDIDHAAKVLKRIMEGVSDNSILSKYGVTFSVGIVQNKGENDVTSLLANADKALYLAKDNGKNKICRA